MPGLLFVGYLYIFALFTNSMAVLRPYNLLACGPAVIWIVVGPILFFRSAIRVSPGRGPVSLDLIRMSLLLGWAASSFIAINGAILV